MSQLFAQEEDMNKRSFLILVFTWLLFLIGKEVVSCAQTAESDIELTIFRDEDSLTIFLSETGKLFLKDLGFRTENSSGEDQTIFLQEYPQLRLLAFVQIGTPICIRLERREGESPLPLDCVKMDLLTHTLNDVDVFWYSDTRHTLVSMAVMRGNDQVGVCGESDSRCEITFSPLPFSTPTPDPKLLPSKNCVDFNSDWIPQSQFFDDVEMVLVPCGCFLIGSTQEDVDFLISLYSPGGVDPTWYEDQFPQHEVCFAEPFWIDRYEVTNSQFANLQEESAETDADVDSSLPRTNVSWFEAVSYCKKRGGRLPTEAEWEYAARGPNSLIFPWGNSVIFGTVRDWSNNETIGPVGIIPLDKAWVDAFDMGGNAWEWTNTIYDQERYPYPYVPSDGREDPDDRRSPRVWRGGAWLTSADRQVAARWSSDPSSAGLTIGFRCVRDLPSNNTE